MAQFLQSRRTIYLSRLQELSRAGSTKAVNGRKAFCHDEIVEVARKNCDKLIAPYPLVIVRSDFDFIKVPVNRYPFSRRGVTIKG